MKVKDFLENNKSKNLGIAIVPIENDKEKEGYINPDVNQIKLESRWSNLIVVEWEIVAPMWIQLKVKSNG